MIWNIWKCTQLKPQIQHYRPWTWTRNDVNFFLMYKKSFACIWRKKKRELEFFFSSLQFLRVYRPWIVNRKREVKKIRIKIIFSLSDFSLALFSMSRPRFGTTSATCQWWSSTIELIFFLLLLSSFEFCCWIAFFSLSLSRKRRLIVKTGFLLCFFFFIESLKSIHVEALLMLFERREQRDEGKKII